LSIRDFKQKMLELMEGKLGESHAGELHRESAEQKAERIIAEEILRLGWKEADLSARLKNDPAKLRMAARVRKETTLPIKWIATRLQMGTSKSAKPMLYEWMRTDGEHTENAGPYAQLRFQPPA
jgi:hypothetical protein